MGDQKLKAKQNYSVEKGRAPNNAFQFQYDTL